MVRFLRLGTLVLAATVFACPAARAAGAAASDSTSRRLLSVPSVHVHNVVARPVLVLAAGGALAAWAYGQENPDVAAARLDGPVGSRIADVGNFYGDGLVIGGAAAGLYAALESYQSSPLVTKPATAASQDSSRAVASP